ncbi:MAG: tetratricopeptide repeat protein [Actinomycetota bacterium]|nr:tetratricopeptide repeat protein [Actinomycetota bacterium]
MGDGIDELVDDIVVDAHDEHDQLAAFSDELTGRAQFPFRASVVGVEVEVWGVDFDGNERRGLVAECWRDGVRHDVGLLDVEPIPPVAAETHRLVDAYRRWSGIDPLDEPTPTGATWVYPRVARIPAPGGAPLELRPMGEWDPATEYWGEPGEYELEPIVLEVIAAGPRPRFEMEQVLPGESDEDLDDDPIVASADMLAAGFGNEARELLEAVIAEDPRCVDAWVHLGVIASVDRGPKAALEYYETAVALGEAALPEGFGGVLPWGMIDNRPFLRGLGGLARCAWRQRRWDEAEAMFTALVWLDPTRWEPVLCLDEVVNRRRWQAD